jgi:hypothetical protein
MEAGRELDKLCAERGLHRATECRNVGLNEEELIFSDDASEVPFFSTSDNGAGHLVESMESIWGEANEFDPLRFRVLVTEQDQQPFRTTVSIVRGNQDHLIELASVTGDSVPLAECEVLLAYLSR